jgi:rare lipoprotein A
MRFLRWGAFVTWLIVTGLAVAGFAAFSPKPADPPSAGVTELAGISEGVAVARGAATGRVLALAFAMAGREAGGSAPELALPVPASTLIDPRADERPQATAAPTTTTAAPISPTATAPPTTAPPAANTATTTATTTPASDPTVPRGEYQWPSGATCSASWYGPGFEGRPTASGEPFDPKALTAALHDVPFDTFVIVTRVDTGDSVTVRVNDRGPFVWEGKWTRHPSRCIDLSQAAMAELGGTGEGVVEVTIRY